MQRTYYIRYNKFPEGMTFDKIVYKDIEDRPSWHKVGALNAWKKEHYGYSHLTIKNVYTKKEMKANGYM